MKESTNDSDKYPFKHTLKPYFLKLYKQLPKEIRKLALEKYQLLKKDPWHPSLHFKEVNSKEKKWSARVTRNVRAVGIKVSSDTFHWRWIFSHDTYDKKIK